MPRAPLTALVFSLLVCGLQAQEPPARPNRGGARGEAAAIAGAKEDPAAVERGAKAYAANCAGCHGKTGRGNPGAPDLIRSIVVLTDEKGILITPILRNGRPDQGMPKPNLTEQQISDLVAWLHVQTYSAGHRNTYAFQDVVTGDAEKGRGLLQRRRRLQQVPLTRPGTLRESRSASIPCPSSNAGLDHAEAAEDVEVLPSMPEMQ